MTRSAALERWSFWIDVGGTFTDCVARAPDGAIRRGKVLSSGVTKGAIAAGSTRQRVVDPLRNSDVPDFWRGFTLRLLDETGAIVAQSVIAASVGSGDGDDGGELQLSLPLSVEPQPGQAYELVGELAAPVLVIRQLLGLPHFVPLPPLDVRLGTTKGTNALLTRRGARTAFVTTRGFADILRIGYQNRPRIFDLEIRKPEPLYEATVEIDERLTPTGEVLVEPQRETIREQLSALRSSGVTSLAICLLNAYAQPRHEQLVEQVAREVGFTEISVSHQIAPLVKLVSRGDTTVVDAYLNPILRSYLSDLRTQLVGGNGEDDDRVDLRVLTSAGGLSAIARFTGKDSVLSGPAGGVVGYSRAARACGFTRSIGFDMGGTSTDVSRFAGSYELEFETEKAGVRIVAPMLSIETVAAGGGSLCGFDGVKLTVGPDSAGADPGPACYGRGGPLAVTDVNFFLGRVLPEFFPFPLDRAAVERRLRERADQIAAATGVRYELSQLAAGYLQVANANMAKAIRSISVAKGFDVRSEVLVPFGGAAPQHACAIARELGMRQILDHPDAGVLSAYGIGLADVVRHRAAGVYQPYSADAVASLEAVFERLSDEARAEVLEEGVDAAQLVTTRSLDLRYRGLDAFLNVPCPDDGDYARQYVADHRRLYGYEHRTRPIEIVAARVEVTGRSRATLEPSTTSTPYSPSPIGQSQTWFEGRTFDTPVYRREALRAGARIAGPAIVVQAHSTTVIEPGWNAELWTGGELVLAADAGERQHATASHDDRAHADPVQLEVFNNHFAAIAQQMGITLRNTSSSVNVKERLDFSCAIFTSTGDLVVNAPHIPVHLGAMGETVRSILADNPTIAPGDVFVTNDPYRGGSHLPDVTVVTPVHDAATGELLFCTASRAHHAEIGGMSPGSMPPFSRTLAEEGVLITNFKVVDAGASRLDRLGELLASGPYPSRAVADNLADLSAQIAANQQGARDLQRMIATHGRDRVLAYMRHIQRAAETKMRGALARRAPGRREFLEHLDDGTPIHVAVTIEGDAATIDFSGSGPTHAENLNANRAIVTAAVMYVLRAMIGEDIPLNQGVLTPVTIVIPPGVLSPPAGATPATSPAVVGGNVETSQRVVDVLLGALDLAAASQGTMNNLLFGDTTFGYYETICGGAGATARANGADAVHTHMTNTRLTDPEVMEQRFPVRVREFSIRRGSGGRGAQRGGDGVVRRLEFLRPLSVSILSQRRGPYSPYGLHGGASGALGRNSLRRAGQDAAEPLPGRVQFQAAAGDELRIETPGGGGWGEPVPEST